MASSSSPKLVSSMIITQNTFVYDWYSRLGFKVTWLEFATIMLFPVAV